MTRWDKSLVAVAGLMTGLGALFGAAMLIDPRTIEGAPAWLKPAKFAVSTAIYSITLAWISSFLTDWPRVRRVAARTTAAVFVLEVALIAMQAWRGTTSHFNTSTPFDGIVFGVMGTAIVLQTLTAAAVAVALWRQAFSDRALGWALRAGMAITIVGASTGGLMTTPTRSQLELARATQQMPRSGAHTVGAADGGPGLPGTGWSLQHGDLRVPHFVGLHAMQALPLALIIFGRRRGPSTRRRLVVGGSLLYVTLFAILLVQALAGQPLTAPAGGVLGALLVWVAAVASFGLWIWRDPAGTASVTRTWRVV